MGIGLWKRNYFILNGIEGLPKLEWKPRQNGRTQPRGGGPSVLRYFSFIMLVRYLAAAGGTFRRDHLQGTGKVKVIS